MEATLQYDGSASLIDDDEVVNLVFVALSHHWRRAILRTFEHLGERRSVPDLASALIAECADAETPAAVETALRHVHLPRMEQARLVDYDSEADAVSPTALGVKAVDVVESSRRAFVVPDPAD